MSLQSNEIRKGMVIMHNGDPCIVLSHLLQKFGRGGSHNKTKLKNLKSGAITPVTFSGNETAEQADVVTKNVQFVYSEGDTAYFMDMSSFEQFTVEIENIPSERDFLKEGEQYQGVFFDDKIISIILPKKMSLKVTSAPIGVKGDSANNPQKEIILETGLSIQAPLFIKEGETVYVNTDSNEYTGRDNT
jgi:elongation factor P